MTRSAYVGGRSDALSSTLVGAVNDATTLVIVVGIVLGFAAFALFLVDNATIAAAKLLVARLSPRRWRGGGR